MLLAYLSVTPPTATLLTWAVMQTLDTITIGDSLDTVGINGTITLTGATTITGGTVLINTTGTANTQIGNATGTFQLDSNTIDISSGGAITGVTGITMASGNFLQTGSGTFGTGTGAISLNGNTTLAAGKYLKITGDVTGSRPGSPTPEWYFTILLLTSCSNTTVRNGYLIELLPLIVAANDSTQAEKDSADYVADGTGDQVEINAALTAAAGGKVYLLPGTYVASATILIPNNTTLAGSGPGTVIELADLDATDNLIENSDTTTGTGVVIRDLKLDGRDDLNTAGTQHGIYFNNMGGGSGASAREGGSILNIDVEDFRTIRYIHALIKQQCHCWFDSPR